MTHSDNGGRAKANAPLGASATDHVKLLAERFPYVRGVSLRVLLQNATFTELCEEYETCVEALQQLSLSTGDPAMRNEYAALSLRLEDELLRYISQNGGTMATRRQ